MRSIEVPKISKDLYQKNKQNRNTKLEQNASKGWPFYVYEHTDFQSAAHAAWSQVVSWMPLPSHLIPLLS